MRKIIYFVLFIFIFGCGEKPEEIENMETAIKASDTQTPEIEKTGDFERK